ncbi:VOC family protein [Agrobacterium rhizogenes]|uniref:VOC family protein n=1 Tax=Rhizobium rhizogenes TaxID=359 RepID=UPI0015722B2F|nr:VOC family protein [Rhizobium rhizogenes]NTF52789.1 VOC family protein [Rhizobium rhizogenes]NTF65819.1 VOC family protein [Rhizobium rhizogenes]NTG18790.1 VOC family protein [Rhizobium rhizogenes]NTG38965.1 VOC family protein [Rhizobium rhizogenes]NTG58091.1 VOC family protein [Rhizobium rhizogenes]
MTSVENLANPTRDNTAVNAPIRIGSITLAVRDLDRATRFYRDVVGLEQIIQDGRTLHFGLENRVLISLQHDPEAAINSSRSAGLYHVAFLLPSRSDLSAWLRHALRLGVRLDGASDHLVSEAIYMLDPEGNGVEIYADRPSSSWTRIQEVIQMGSGPLALGELSRSTNLSWNGMPPGGTIGHVHLQVGDLGSADSFYGQLLGFKINAAVPTARFYSTGGYHHQIAGNIWQSSGAAARRPGTTGLVEVELLVRDQQNLTAMASRLSDAGKPPHDDEQGPITFDPWNIRLRLTAGNAA